METCFPGVLFRISIGRCRPATLIVPFSSRVISFLTADAPPTAFTYLARICSTGGTLGAADASSSSVMSGTDEAPVSTMTGIATGRTEPR